MRVTSFAIGTGPAGEADFATVLVADVVAELVVPGPAKLHARGVVVIGVALDADAVRHLGAPAVVRQRVPVPARHQNTRVDGPFDLPLPN